MLKPLQSIDRLLSAPEYYHACTGRHPRTVVSAREFALVIEGRSSLQTEEWKTAFDRVVAANPGLRLRLVGHRQNARWISDGPPPAFRVVERCDWDGRSETGTDFLYRTALSLETGPVAELIVIGRKEVRLVFRALHAAMDGLGGMHVFAELFRALRGEPLSGSNAPFSDSDLMRSVPAEWRRLKKIVPASLTGPTQGDRRGGTWRRLSLAGPLSNLLPRLAMAIAVFARQHDPGAPVRIALPVNLRRHMANLNSTMNFTGMLFLDIGKDDDVAAIKARIAEMLEKNVETNHPRLLGVIRYLPFAWLDRFVSANESNYVAPPLFETAVVSMVSGFKRSMFSCPGFTAEVFFAVPLQENVFIAVCGLQGKYEISVGMPHVFASNGRLDAFLRFIETQFTTERIASPASP